MRGFVVGLLVAALVAGCGQRESEPEASTESVVVPVVETVVPAATVEKSVIDLPGFEPVETVVDDPVARELQVLVQDYQQWLANQAPSSRTAPITEYVRLHNVFARKVEAYVSVPQVTVADMSTEIDFNSRMSGLQQYLEERGWASGFESPVPMPNADRIGVLVYVGKVASRHKGQLTRFDGKVVPVTEDVLTDVTKLRFGNFSLTSRTKWHTIHHFYDTMVETSRKTARTCEEIGRQVQMGQIPTDDGNLFAWLEWGQGPTVDAEVVLRGMFSITSQHERQHVRDQELLAAVNTYLGKATQLQLSMVIEARGLLAGIAHGQYPFQALGHACRWTGSEEEQKALAGELVVGCFDGIRPKLDDLPTTRQQIIQAAEKSLQEIDVYYPDLARLLAVHDPDPFAQLSKKWAKGQ